VPPALPGSSGQVRTSQPSHLFDWFRLDDWGIDGEWNPAQLDLLAALHLALLRDPRSGHGLSEDRIE